MDIFLMRGVKYFCVSIPKITAYTFSTNVPLSLCRYSNVACHKIQYLDKYVDRSCQIKNCNIPSIHYDKLLTSSILPTKIDAVQYSTSAKDETSSKSETTNKDCYTPPTPPVDKRTIFQKMKQMTKDYWHILIPVHIVTSIGWTAMFYIAAKNGVDIVGIMEYLNLSEKYLEYLRGSSAGHWAVTYALYKIFTPIRYTVTVGGTTLCIRYLNKWGYLKFKTNPKLLQSIKCADEHKTKFGKRPFISSKSSESQTTKT